MIVSAVTKNPKKAAGLTGLGAILGGVMGSSRDSYVKKLRERRKAQQAGVDRAGTGGR